MSGFKQIAVPAGLPGERIAGFLTAYNAQSDKLEEVELQLMDFLKPFNGGRDYAWQGTVMAAMRYSGGVATARRGNNRLYDRIQALAIYLQKESDKRPLGEFSDYRVSELLLLASNITSSRPRSKHASTKSPVPADCIYELAFHYRHCTGKAPGAGAGPFAGFVAMFWEATGHAREYNTVLADLKKARKARPAAFNGKPDED